MALGNGGNFLVLMPEQRALAVFSGMRFNRPDALESRVWVRDHILPELAARPWGRGGKRSRPVARDARGLRPGRTLQILQQQFPDCVLLQRLPAPNLSAPGIG
jgi:hypothetical protein